MIQTNKLKTISLTELIEVEQESGEVDKFLKSFKCEANKSVQDYLWDQSIESEKRLFSKTTLVVYYDEATRRDEIVGYFTIRIKNFTFTDASGTSRNKLTGNKLADSFTTILIAQLGRADSYKGRVGGSVILDLALEKCESIKDLSALRIVCVEHDDNEKLNIFYEENGFKILQVNNQNYKIIRYVRL